MWGNVLVAFFFVKIRIPEIVKIRYIKSEVIDETVVSLREFMFRRRWFKG